MGCALLICAAMAAVAKVVVLLPANEYAEALAMVDDCEFPLTLGLLLDWLDEGAETAVGLGGCATGALVGATCWGWRIAGSWLGTVATAPALVVPTGRGGGAITGCCNAVGTTVWLVTAEMAGWAAAITVEVWACDGAAAGAPEAATPPADGREVPAVCR